MSQTGERSPSGDYRSAEVVLRLVAEDARADGTIRAAVLVDLQPGWKTYWINPGEAGIPPRVDLSGRNVSATVALYPVPHRFGEGFGRSNGYSQPIAIALDVRQVTAGAPTDLEAKVTLGVCEEVCIPVTAELQRPAGPADPAETRLVEAAFRMLPEPSTGERGVVGARLGSDGKVLVVESLVPEGRGDRSGDLFVAGPEGWSFGAPSSRSRNGRSLGFEVPILARPRDGEAAPLVIDAVLTIGARAYGVSGLAVDGPG